MLTVEGVTKRYASPQGPVEVLSGVGFSLADGESLALMGESGSGKSTLLHLVAGLDAADAGRILVGNADVGSLGDAGRAALRRERMGIVFQQYNLIPSLTVGGNLSFQARLAGLDEPDRTTALADRLGLAAMLERYPEALSGGQQQRVAIGRALAHRPPLVLADEPTGNLDEATGDEVIDLMLELVAETGAALLMVTHSARLAARCDRVLTLHAGHLE